MHFYHLCMYVCMYEIGIFLSPEMLILFLLFCMSRCQGCDANHGQQCERCEHDCQQRSHSRHDSARNHAALRDIHSTTVHSIQRGNAYLSMNVCMYACMDVSILVYVCMYVCVHACISILRHKYIVVSYTYIPTTRY